MPSDVLYTHLNALICQNKNGSGGPITYQIIILTEAKIESLKERRDEMSITLVKNMRQLTHKLHSLLPTKPKDIKERETRTNGQKMYNFFRRTERFKHSSLVYAIDLYNGKLK